MPICTYCSSPILLPRKKLCGSLACKKANHAANTVALWHKRVQSGKCSQFGCPRSPLPDKRMCRPCLEALKIRTRAWNKADSNRRKKAGLCVCAGCPNHSEPGKSTCQPCTVRRAKYPKKRKVRS